MNILLRALAIFLICGCLTNAASAQTGHRVILHGNGRLAILSADGSIEWQRKWGGIHDLHVLDNGNVMVQRGPSEIVEIDKKTNSQILDSDGPVIR